MSLKLKIVEGKSIPSLDVVGESDPFYGDTLEEIMATSYEACLL